MALQWDETTEPESPENIYAALRDRMDWSWETLANHLNQIGETRLAEWAGAQDKPNRATKTKGTADAAKPNQTR